MLQVQMQVQMQVQLQVQLQIRMKLTVLRLLLKRILLLIQITALIVLIKTEPAELANRNRAGGTRIGQLETEPNRPVGSMILWELCTLVDPRAPWEGCPRDPKGNYERPARSLASASSLAVLCVLH